MISQRHQLGPAIHDKGGNSGFSTEITKRKAAVSGNSLCSRLVSHDSGLPSGELTYPTLGKGKSFSKSALEGDMLVPWRVVSWQQDCRSRRLCRISLQTSSKKWTLVGVCSHNSTEKTGTAPAKTRKYRMNTTGPQCPGLLGDFVYLSPGLEMTVKNLQDTWTALRYGMDVWCVKPFCSSCILHLFDCYAGTRNNPFTDACRTWHRNFLIQWV